MKNRFMRVCCKIPMNLQTFAEGGDGAGAEGNGGGSGTGDTGSGTGGEGGDGSTPPTFDDFLKGDGNQAEFDRRVNQAINTAVSNAHEKWQLMTDDKISEAEKLAKMTKEEKTQYMTQKKEKELADRESAITKKELMAEAKNTLAGKGIPAELAEVLNYTDAESCKNSIGVVETAFQAAVEAAVQERLKGDKPPKGAPDGNTTLEQQIENAMMGL